jgi:hypothetical protein
MDICFVKCRQAVFAVLVSLLAFPTIICAQRTAILVPDMSAQSRDFADKLAWQLADKVRLLDVDLARAAYLSVSPDLPFNLTVEESKRIGSAIGCEAFVMVRSVNQRRSALGRPAYYEAFAVIYVISSRTGHLIWWNILSREADVEAAANKLLAAQAGAVSAEIAAAIRSSLATEINEPDPPTIEDVPETGSPLAKGLRPPVPYRRIKPEYTPLAADYEVTATVDALVDLDAGGRVLQIQVVRWAGFGLDGSVEKAIRSMNWKPAERNGKPLPMRFLLRYNFKKLDKDPSPR